MRILLCLLLSPFLLSAQKNDIKWGKVPDEDLQMTVYEADTSAVAVVLADLGSVKFDFERTGAVVETDIHQRIKILKQPGFDYGNVELPFYSKDNLENITNVRAQVFHPDGSVVKLEKGEIFEIKTSDNFSSIKFSFPNLVEGSVIEYKYRREKRGLFSLPDWYFQREIPVRLSELTMTVPEFYNYVTLNQGRLLDVQKITEAVDRITVATREGTVPLDVRVNNHHYRVEDVPALKEESFITTMNDYYARIRFQLQSVQFPGELREEVMTTWSELAKELAETSSFGGRINRKGGVKKMTEALESALAGVTDTEQKAAIIYQFVAENLKWNEIYSAYANQDGDDCYVLGSGNSGEINLAYLALLRAHEIEAYPIMVSTRGHGKMVPLYPFEDQFNHTVVLIVLEGKQVLADLPSTVRPLGYLHINSLNGMGWLVDKEIQQWVTLSAPSATEIVMVSGQLDGNGKLSGEFTVSEDGYFGVTRRVRVQEEDTHPWLADLKEDFPDAVFRAQEESGLENSFDPYKLKLALDLPEYAQGDEDFLYFSPFVFKFFDENPFTLEERTYPVEIPFALSGKYILNLEIPEGFEVLEVPEAAKVLLPNEGGSFSFRASVNGNRIQIISDYALTQLTYEPQDYLLIKAYFDALINKEEEQIVLQRTK